MDGRQGGRAGPAGRRSRAAAACRSPGTGRVDRTAGVAAPRDPGCCPGHVTRLLAGGGGTPASRPTATAHGGRPVSPRTDVRWADGPSGSGVRLLATASFTVPRPRW